MVLQIIITASVIIVMWLALVFGGFYSLMAMRVATSKNAGVVIRVLYALFFIIAGLYYLFLSPIVLRPIFGETVFIIVAIALAFVVLLFAVMALMTALKGRK